MKKKVAIIGAGIGGLCTAIRLLSKGYSVTIFEKSDKIGGKTNLIEEHGYKFDLTASILMLPKDYKEVFSYANKDYKDYFTLIQLDTLYRVNYSDGSFYDFSSNLPNLYKTIDKITLSDLKNRYGYLRFLSSSYKKHLLAEEYFLNKPFLNFTDFFNFKTLKEGFKTHTLTNCYSNLTSYINNEKLLNYLLFQSMYVGISPFEGPNIYNLIPTVSQVYGLYYINGGMYSYIKSLEKLIIELGGNIKLNSEVNKILIKDNSAYGVLVKNEELLFDTVVCNSDFSYTISNLIEKKYLGGKFSKVENFKHSCSTFIMYLGVKKKYNHLKVNNIYIPKNFNENINAPFHGKIPDSPPLYIYCPSSIDNSMAPSGCDSINVMMRVPNLEFKDISWDKTTIESCKKVILNTLKSIKGLEDIEDNIDYISYTNPKTFLEEYNTYAGTAFGLSHTLTQTNYFRPQCKLNNINNLYFTGASIHPGNGVSMVIKSSKICTEEIIKDSNLNKEV